MTWCSLTLPAPFFRFSRLGTVLSALNRHEEALPHFAYLTTTLPSGEMRRAALVQVAEVKRILGRVDDAAAKETKA